MPLRLSLRLLFCTIVVMVGLSFGAPALAQASATVGTPDNVEANLTGFRSAQFGMSEEAVLEAIKADFGFEDDDINIGVNTVERTRVISIQVPGILPEGGTAQVSYIFGYQSKALIQVGLLWSPVVDASITDETLYANGELLASFFAGAGYQADTIVRDVVFDTGILLFRGSDPEGHTAILLLQGRFEGEDGNLTLMPETLTLLYAVNPDDPDILKISPGDF